MRWKSSPVRINRLSVVFKATQHKALLPLPPRPRVLRWPGRSWPQHRRRTLQLLHQFPRIIRVNPVLPQRLRHIADGPLHGLHINQWWQRVLCAPPAFNIRLLLVLVASVSVFHGRRLALLPILAKPLAPPIVAIPLLHYLAVQCSCPSPIAVMRVFHRNAFPFSANLLATSSIRIPKGLAHLSQTASPASPVKGLWLDIPR
jgi:hypothetical protein